MLVKGMEKIRCIIKKWQRFAKIGFRSYSAARPSREQSTTDDQCRDDDNNNNITNSPPVHYDQQEEQIPAIPKGYVAVYVGNSRRRYVISCQYINHPLLSVLIQKSEGGGGGDHGYLAIGCEVVLFEHLLWMLQNADDDHTDPLEELVEFYAC